MAAARTIKVFTDREALNAVKADPEGFLDLKVKIDPKTKEPKEYQGSIYLNATYKVNGSTNDGWFTTTEDIPLMRGCADPTNKLDKRNEFEGTRLQLEMKRSQSGPMGEFIDTLDGVWVKKTEKMTAEKKIPGVTKYHRLHRLMQYNLSEKNKENPEGVIEDPVLRFQIDKGVFSKDYPYAFLRLQPKTVFYDYSTKYVDERGNTQYKQATIFDDATGKDVLVNTDNMHRFITSGTILKAGSRIMMPSASRSGSWISLPIIINKAVLEKRAEVEGFSDEVPVDMNALKEALTTTETPVTEKEESQPELKSEEPVIKQESPAVDEVDDMLANI
jgi:hypothetical protein